MQTSRRRGPCDGNGRGPAPGKLKLREENVAAAPRSPWGGGEGLFNNPWSGLLTRRMLTQGKKGSNAPGAENSEWAREPWLERKSLPRPGKNTRTSTRNDCVHAFGLALVA